MGYTIKGFPYFRQAVTIDDRPVVNMAPEKVEEQKDQLR